MFHNPFNSKIVNDITKFLNEHRNDVQIDPCLHEKAEQTAEIIATQGILEDRRNTIVTMFNEAVQECGCRGTNKEANEFAKAVQLKLEANSHVEEEDQIQESALATAISTGLASLLIGGFGFVALNFLFDNAFTPSSIRTEYDIFVRRWKNKVEGKKLSKDGGQQMAQELRGLIEKLPKERRAYLSGLVTRMQKTLKPNKDGKIDREKAGELARDARERIKRLSGVKESQDSDLAEMGKTIVVPGKKTSEPSSKDSELAKMGKTIKVPGKKTAEPSHKDSDLAKMGTKIVVPGKKS